MKGNYIEERVINAVKDMLVGRVNELLGEVEFYIEPIEFIGYAGGGGCRPVLCLSTGERTEKERIVRVEAYGLTIGFSVPEGAEAERGCYAYAAAVAVALGEDPSLGGVVDRAVMAGKEYRPPKYPGTGGDWEVILTVRIIREE